VEDTFKDFRKRADDADWAIAVGVVIVWLVWLPQDDYPSSPPISWKIGKSKTRVKKCRDVFGYPASAAF
jgi:hypothetical protein